MSDRAGHGLPIAFSCLLEILVIALRTGIGGSLPTRVREAKRPEDLLAPMEARRPEGTFRLEDLLGPMEAGWPGGAFGSKSALFSGAVADFLDGETNAFASLRRPFDARTL